MENSAKIDISDLIDNSRIGGFQVALFVLSAACLVMTGFTVQMMGYVGPAILPEFGIAGSQLGNIIGAANLGILLGSLVFTIMGDKIGRRPALVGATLFYSVLTLATAGAGSAQELLILRFLAGLGLGAIIPNATALISEYSPRRNRVTLIMTITVGFTAGAAFGGFLAAWMIPNYGWRSVFVFAGSVPLVIGILMIFLLPESLQFLALKGKRDKVGRWLARIAPGASIGPDTEYVVPEENRRGVPVRHLFSEGRALTTVLYWTVNFTNLINLYFLAGLLPTVLTQAGHATQTAVLVGALLQTGGTIGTFGLAWIIAKKGFTPVLTGSFAVACLSIALLGSPPVLTTVGLLTIVVFIVGWGVIGAQPGVNALAATYYPTSMRSTGVGWGLGIGRIGAILGPVVGGQLMSLQWSSQRLFLAFAIPALISTLVMLSLHFVMRTPREPAAQAKRQAIAH